MDNLIGKTLDGLYTVRELIGTGGMANVYKAVVGPGGPVPEGTVVAVKVLRQELMHDPDLVRRFKNESKAISLLNHPNIVKVYDVSVTDKLQYIVMEYVDGITLKEYLKQRGGALGRHGQQRLNAAHGECGIQHQRLSGGREERILGGVGNGFDGGENPLNRCGPRAYDGVRGVFGGLRERQKDAFFALL